MVNSHQPPLAPSSSPTQKQVYHNVKPATQGDVKSNNNVNSLVRINAQKFNSPGVSVELAESVMARATKKWVQSNMTKDGGQGSNLTTTCGNKRKQSWDELVAEEYDKEQPMILANQLEWNLNVRTEKKNKRVMREKQDMFKMYLNNKKDAIRKLNRAQVGESSSADNEKEDN